MRITTLGIGIDKLSVGHVGVNIYGNEKFAAWVGDHTLRLKRVTATNNNQIFCFARGGGSPVRLKNGVQWWTRNWSKNQPRPAIFNFGATGPLDLQLTGDNELEIIMPLASQCRKEKYPDGFKRRVKVAALTPEEPTEQSELLLDTPVTEVTNEPDACADYGPEPAPTDLSQHMRDAVSTINAFKGMWGDSILLTLTTDGRLRVYEAHD